MFYIEIYTNSLSIIKNSVSVSHDLTRPLCVNMALVRSCRLFHSNRYLSVRTFFGSIKDGRKVSQSKVLGDVSSQIFELQSEYIHFFSVVSIVSTSS